jgi:hypothetical protein
VHSSHGKVKATFAAAEPHPAVKPAAGKRGGGSDPFESYEGGASAPAPLKRAAKPAPELAPVARSSARSSDGLDELMAGAARGTGSKPSAKHNTSKEIDTMLKDVQKSDPPPPPKRAEPAPLPPLTAANITAAMAGVKTEANACGKRFGQTGIAELTLAVAKDGKVTEVAVRGALADSPVGRCVAKAARRASFPRNAGLKFDYRIAVQ